MRLKGQASMIDILLLALFISVVLVGSFVFLGTEELRAQKGREEAVYAQAQLVAGLNYRQADWNNMTVSQKAISDFCNRKITSVDSTCYSADQNYTAAQKMMNRTGRTGYNYILYASFSNATDADIANYTVCNRQPTACAKNIPAIATVSVVALCPSGEYVKVDWLNGLWPDWMVLPLWCED